MLPKESTYEKNPTSSGTDVTGTRPLELQQTDLDVKLGQLEVLVGALKEKVDSSLELKKWFVVALLTLFGIIVGLLVSVGNFINSNLNSHRELQREYYEQLIQSKNEVNSLIIMLEKKGACLQKNSYWEYKNCFLKK